MSGQELCSLAQGMLSRAYCPYSNYPVGAALECADGSVFTGCNVENAAYSPGICAERTAAVKAVSEGRRDFVRLAIACGQETHAAPCGLCRQFLYEFNPALEIFLVNRDSVIRRFTLGELLPEGFGPANLTGNHNE